ncbi:MAG: anti-sigma factor antagonist [Chloroflexi bacterium]|nr:MAG: anti-sigma factor antagonist [Chloroflexota bacterium]
MSESLLNISVESLKRVDLITVSGRIDSSNVTELEDALNNSLQNGRFNLVLDMADVNYISSAGLRAIVAALRDCSKRGGGVRIARPSDRVQEVLSLAGLDSLFPIYEDTVSAVGSF